MATVIGVIPELQLELLAFLLPYKAFSHSQIGLFYDSLTPLNYLIFYVHLYDEL